MEFLGKEELISVSGLGRLLRRISSLTEKLKSDDERFRFIRKPLEDLIQKMSAVFVTVEQADAAMPYLANPISTDPEERDYLARIREYFTHTESIHSLPNGIRQRLRKLNEFPTENRVDDEVISALFRQHQRWTKRQGPANNAGDWSQIANGTGSRKTASIKQKILGPVVRVLVRGERPRGRAAF